MPLLLLMLSGLLLPVVVLVVVVLDHANNNGEWRNSKRPKDSLREPAQVGSMLNN